jgi:PncC family amidohydrolase
MIATRITDVPGSSRVFWGGFVVYENEAKRNILGIRSVEQFGAVSSEVVTEMASRAVEKSGTDVSIAVSGIAGPGGGTDEKPVGTVYIGIGRLGRPSRSYRIYVSGDRDRVRRRTTLTCLLLATGEVLEKNIDTDILSNYI